LCWLLISLRVSENAKRKDGDARTIHRDRTPRQSSRLREKNVDFKGQNSDKDDKPQSDDEEEKKEDNFEVKLLSLIK